MFGLYGASEPPISIGEGEVPAVALFTVRTRPCKGLQNQDQNKLPPADRAQKQACLSLRHVQYHCSTHEEAKLLLTSPW